AVGTASDSLCRKHAALRRSVEWLRRLFARDCLPNSAARTRRSLPCHFVQSPLDMEHAAHHAVSGGPLAIFVLLNFVPAALLCAYVHAVIRTRRTSHWSNWRLASFTSGIVLVIVAMSPPVSGWAHGDLRGHMVQHLMLGMFAPLALVLGAPGTLLLRNVSLATARRIVAILGTRPVRVVIHPFTAAMLNIGVMYVLYLTPLYSYSLNNAFLHLFIHVHFLMAGYLFVWSIAGPDPAPHRPG